MLLFLPLRWQGTDSQESIFKNFAIRRDYGVLLVFWENIKIARIHIAFILIRLVREARVHVIDT